MYQLTAAPDTTHQLTVAPNPNQSNSSVHLALTQRTGSRQVQRFKQGLDLTLEPLKNTLLRKCTNNPHLLIRNNSWKTGNPADPEELVIRSQASRSLSAYLCKQVNHSVPQDSPSAHPDLHLGPPKTDNIVHQFVRIHDTATCSG